MTQQFRKVDDQEFPEVDEFSDGSAPGAVTAPVRRVVGRQGFLPIRTNTFDRVFIGVVFFVAIHLLWMRFLEAFLPLWIATLLSLVLAVIIVRWG
jgi:predicted small integral membrane protein